MFLSFLKTCESKEGKYSQQSDVLLMIWLLGSYHLHTLEREVGLRWILVFDDVIPLSLTDWERPDKYEESHLFAITHIP